MSADNPIPHKPNLMRCTFTKPSGTPCRAHAITDSAFCFSHDPVRAGERAVAVVKGGHAPKPRKDAIPLAPLPVKCVKDVLLLIEDTMNRVRTEPMTHQKANCIGYLATVALKALEVGELEDRVAKIEEIIAERGH